MIRILITLLCFSSLTLAGCRKKDRKEYTITGRMMMGCTTPASNQTFSLRQKANTIGSKEGQTIDFTCDENGYFSIKYRPVNSRTLDIRSGVSDLLESIPSGENLDLGNVYFLPPVANIIIKLDVTNQHSSSDTLKIANPNQFTGYNAYLRYPGPFQSGILDTIFNAKLSLPQRYDGDYSYLGAANLNVNSISLESINVQVCDGTFHTQTIKIP